MSTKNTDHFDIVWYFHNKYDKNTQRYNTDTLKTIDAQIYCEETQNYHNDTQNNCKIHKPRTETQKELHRETNPTTKTNKKTAKGTQVYHKDT